MPFKSAYSNLEHSLSTEKILNVFFSFSTQSASFRRLESDEDTAFLCSMKLMISVRSAGVISSPRTTNLKLAKRGLGSSVIGVPAATLVSLESKPDLAYTTFESYD